MIKSYGIFIFLLLSSICYSQLDEIEWIPVGLGGGGGQFSPAISPLDSTLMFVSCDMSGVYKSTNSGAEWEMINYRQIKSSINCSPVFHPLNENIIYDESGRNLMKSTDKGRTWFQVSNFDNYIIDLLMPLPKNNEVVIYIATASGGLYKMVDGLDYEKIDNVINPQFLAGNKNIIVANNSRMWILKEESNFFEEITNLPQLHQTDGIIDVAIDNGTIYLLELKKLWRSTNYGDDWINILNSDNFPRGDFRFVRASKNFVWVTTKGAKYQPTVFLSKNAGENFEAVFFCNSSWDDNSNLISGWLSLDFNCGWGGAAIGFNISSTNPEIALWTDYGRTLLTTNAGDSWEAVYTNFSDDEPRESGKFWSSRGLEVTSSWDLFIPDDQSNFVNVAYTDIGGAYSFDYGNRWRSTIGNGIPSEWRNTTYDFEYDEKNQLLWGAFSGRHDIPAGWSANYWYNEGNGGVGISTDYGQNWSALTNNSIINKPVTSVAVDKSSLVDNRIIYAAVWSNGVWRSTNGGSIWERKSEGLDCGDGSNSSDGPNTHVVEVKVHPDGTVFALKTKYLRDDSKIKNDAGLWKSTDKGDSWIFISPFVEICNPNPSIDLNGEHSWADAISFELDESDINHIFVCAQNANNGKVQGGLYETTDGGNNWTRIYQTYAAHRLTKSKYYPGRYYLATAGEGVLYSNDYCKTWEQFHNFPFAHTTRITEDPIDSNKIWINTFGGGVWIGIFKTETNVIESKIEEKIELIPNPCTDYFTLNLNNFDKIEIYSILGKKIVQINELPILTKSLNSGIYFIKISIGKKIYWRKFIKM